MLEIVGGILVIILILLVSGIKAVRENHALVVFRLGRAVRCVGPGLQFVAPLFEQAELIDTRIVTLPIASVSEATQDKLPVEVSALCLFQVTDPMRSISKVRDILATTGQICEITLRNVINQNQLRHILGDRGRINWTLKTLLERRLKSFGVKIISIEINEIRLSREARKALMREREQSVEGTSILVRRPVAAARISGSGD